MKLYHFSIDGELGHIGLAGDIVAANDKEALESLQAVLDCAESFSLGLNGTPATGRIDYANIYTNGAQATMEMFETITECEAPSQDLPPIADCTANHALRHGPSPEGPARHHD